MTASQLPKLLVTAMEAADLARDLFLKGGTGGATAKGERDFATATDYRIERAVRDFLASETPEIGFLGEEEGRVNNGSVDGAYWALDPVDGTANLMHRIPMCGTSLGLVHRGQPVLGVIDFPHLAERYHAYESAGAFCNGLPIHASATASLRQAIVSVGDFAVGVSATERNHRRHAILVELAAEAERVRMLGSAALDLAWVAAGRLDASVMLSNKPWDVAAGIAIAREAGALVLDQDGLNHGPDSFATVSVAPGLSTSLLDLLARTAESASI